MVVHQHIIRSFLDGVFNPCRTPFGIVIWFTTTEAKAAAVAHNLRMCSGSPLFPPVESDEIKGATLSCSHFNVALRCFKAQMQSVDSSGCARLCDATVDRELANAVAHGHKWHVLSERCPPDTQRRISEWKNQDQNSNQVRHEIELIRAIQAMCLKEATVAQKASVGGIAQLVNLASPVKVPSSALHAIVAFVMAVGAAHPSLERLCHFHAHNVNPGARTMLHTTFEALGKHLGASSITSRRPSSWRGTLARR